MSRPEDMGQRVLRVRRPDWRTVLPEQVEMKVYMPPSRHEVIEMVRSELARQMGGFGARSASAKRYTADPNELQ